jgi:hypothetical protein
MFSNHATMGEKIAWAAGLFEGEGTVSCYIRKRGSRRPAPRVAMGMTDPKTVEQFAEIMGFGTISVTRKAVVNRKAIYRWQVGSWKDAEAAFSILGPWLHARRFAQFEKLLAAKPAVLMKPGDYLVAKTHCPHGHAYTPSNTYVHKTHRACRTCRRLRQRIRNAKAREQTRTKILDTLHNT